MKVVMQNDGDFVEVMLLHMKVTTIEIHVRPSIMALII